MSKTSRSTIEVQGTSISIMSQPGGDYISLTDMVRNFDGSGALIEQWLKNKDTVLFLGVWERINNPDFNSIEFEGIRNPTKPTCSTSPSLARPRGNGATPIPTPRGISATTRRWSNSSS